MHQLFLLRPDRWLWALLHCFHFHKTKNNTLVTTVFKKLYFYKCSNLVHDTFNQLLQVSSLEQVWVIRVKRFNHTWSTYYLQFKIDEASKQAWGCRIILWFFFLSPKKTIINSIDSRAPRVSSIKVAGGWEWAALGGRWKRLYLWVVTGFWGHKATQTNERR